MGAVKLSDHTIAGLSCPAGRRDMLFFDAKLKGFGVRVTAGGARVFLYQYRIGSKVRRHRLGNWPNVTTAQARKLAEILRGAVQGGADPVAETKARQIATLAAERAAKQRKSQDAFTVGVLIDGWRDGHLADRSASYQATAPKRLRSALGPFIELPAGELDRAAAVEVLDTVKAAFGPIAANRVRAYGRACFGWAVRRGTIASNPFATVPKPAQERARERVLTDAELGRVWQASGTLGVPWQPIMRMLILTGQRRGEVAGMQWSELRLEPIATAVWTLPGQRTKNGRPHDVPLSGAALDVLAGVPRFTGCPFVFSLGRETPPSGFGKAKARLDAAVAEVTADEMPPWTLHDLRRTVATGLQRLGVRLEVTEAVLNHVSGSRAGIVGVYQRHAWTAEKRAALDAWGRMLIRSSSQKVS